MFVYKIFANMLHDASIFRGATLVKKTLDDMDKKYMSISKVNVLIFRLPNIE